jgi:hypothetical protein
MLPSLSMTQGWGQEEEEKENTLLCTQAYNIQTL